MQYEQHFREVSENINNNIREALEEVGKFGTAEAQARTPVDTGNLRRSLCYKHDGKNRVDIGTNVDYAEYVHNGTSRQHAQPFIKDAIMQNISEINNIISSFLSRVGGD